MDIFLLLFQNLIPLYVLIALGWIAGRYFDVDRQSLGSLGIYILMPVVAFGFVAKLDFKPIYTALPIIAFVLSAAVTLIFYWIGQKTYPDKRANLLGMCAGAGNTGYLGLPLVLLLFPTEWIGVYIFALLGGLIYEATVMYYVANRGKFDVMQSFKKLLKFPTIYTIVLALIVNFSDFTLPEQFDTYWSYFKGSYVVIGMMIIGASLAKSNKLLISYRFLSLTFVGKFLTWPLFAYALIYLDQNLLGWFVPEVHRIFFVMAIVPPAANVAAFAAQLDLNPEKAATTILIGTVLALFTIPLMLALSGLF